MTSMPVGSFASVLEADLRQLSSDARRSEGFVGWLSGPEHPEIKEAAERALLKLRQSDNNVALIRTHKEIIWPFILACEVKNTKLVSVALVSIQRMLANNAVSADGVESVVATMEQVEASHDEGVLLKLLQTALTLFQSFQDVTEDQVRRMLGVCFRILSNTRNSDSVHNTAAATVRQAVALVFDHVLGAPTSPDGALSGSISLASDASERSTAALKLLDDLCHLAVGQEAQWVNTPPLPTIFVLDVLDFILANSARVFCSIAEFEHALLVRICQLLINQLQELLNKTKMDAADTQSLRVVLRVVRTVVRNFYRQLKQKCGVFIETLLEGVTPNRPLQQRVLILQVLRSWCAETDKLQFLFETYDMRPDCKLKAVEQLSTCFTVTLEGALRLGGELGADDPLLLVANLYYSRQSGKSWTLDSDFTSAPSDVALAYLSMLAIDCMLNVVAATERLVDRAAPFPGEAPGPGAGAPVSHETAVALVTATWRPAHVSLNQLLSRCVGEALTLQLLRGYQSMAQACGALDMTDARDAFIAGLCEFALMPQPLADDAKLAAADSGGVSSPLSGAASPPSTRGAALESAITEGLVLTPKNVQALRTLFNVAHRLHATLGPSWVLVLETLNALDRVLLAPNTTTQELSSAVGTSSRPSDLTILSTAATQLFAATASMEDAAVLSMIMGLREVSQRSLLYGTLQPAAAPVRLFAVGRMVEVLQNNRHRLPDLWRVFAAHVGDILANSSVRPAVRVAAAEVLGRAVSALLSSPPLQQHQGPILQPASSVNTECMLLRSLRSLQQEAVEQDAALGILRVCTTVLQHHGDRLQDGWEHLLAMLEHAAQASEALIVREAFPNVQLIASDYVVVMPHAHMLHALRVAALFGAQQADLNISLTTITCASSDSCCVHH